MFHFFLLVFFCCCPRIVRGSRCRWHTAVCVLFFSLLLLFHWRRTDEEEYRLLLSAVIVGCAETWWWWCVWDVWSWMCSTYYYSFDVTIFSLGFSSPVSHKTFIFVCIRSSVIFFSLSFSFSLYVLTNTQNASTKSGENPIQSKPVGLLCTLTYYALSLAIAKRMN